ncbi:CobW family GTP-binding protein [Rhizobium rhizosphaerae]|uniref:CobW family GTP-binding protein n=1 Tax=Xaviernesmea rhizosphaerae TaxID=1672749 RepID=UPI001FDA6C08|nr:GTP-binding protein [Xaviernesmea rhizosphaerae]
MIWPLRKSGAKQASRAAPAAAASGPVQRADATPLFLLTGFLGAGKTTLLNRILADPRFADSAVIINEFGAVPVDHDLVRHGAQRVTITASGCLCCTVQGDLRGALFALQEERAKGRGAAFSRVIVETTGLADPAPVVAGLIPGTLPAFGLRDHVVARRFRLARVIAAFDLEHGAGPLENHFECWKQLAFADEIVLTKGDRAAADPWLAELAALNPAAGLHVAAEADFDLAALLRDGAYQAASKPEDVAGWLALEARATGEGGALSASHAAPPSPSLPGDRHGGIVSLSLTHDGPLDRNGFSAFLHVLATGQRGEMALLRAKGIVAYSDAPDRPEVVHLVGQKLCPALPLDRWPSADRRSRLVLIGRALREEPLRKLFAVTRR